MTDREFIQHLMNVFAERRSDVVEMCEQHIQGKELREPESRFVQARIPGTDIEVEYDTLLTELSYHQPLELWSICTHHVYVND